MGRNIKCQQCQVGNLKRQDRIPHGEKYYRCGQCSSPAKKTSESKKHVRTHKREMPFNCSLCSYATTSRRNLERHERIHTGEKPFNCQYCSYKAIQKVHLQAHERSHTRKDPYKCRHCSYTSIQKSHLITHEWTHSRENPFKCGICNYKTAYRSNLKNHEQIHTGFRPFECRYCSYAAAQRYLLIRHERTHERSTLRIQNRAQSEDYPLKWNISSKAFTKAQVFNKHLKSRDLDSGGKGSKRQPDLKELAVSEKNIYRPGDLRGSFHDREEVKTGSQMSFRIFICEECNYALFSEKELRMHYAFCHKKLVVLLEDPIGQCNNNSKELIGAYVLLERIDELI